MLELRIDMKPQTELITERHSSERIADLGDSDLLMRQRARSLRAYRDQESVLALLEALESPNERTRWEAVKALGEMRAPESISALTNMLIDQNTGIRWAAMESLIRMGRESLRPVLEKFVKNFDSPWMREGLHHILHVLKDRHQLNDLEIALFEKLDEQCIPGFESGWTSEQAWAAEKALEALDQEAARLR